MGKVILCDRCGKSMKDDKEKMKLWRHKCKWTYYEFDCEISYSDKEIYLCGECTNKFIEWLNRKEVDKW